MPEPGTRLSVPAGETPELKGLLEVLSPENHLLLADEMMLSSADGTILQVSENYEKTFGFESGTIVGRNAFDLEEDGTFSPCLTAMVIRGGRRITISQTINRTHKYVMSVGIPLFGPDGQLQYVICFNTVTMQQINAIRADYEQMQASVAQVSSELAALKGRRTGDLVASSPAMHQLFTMLEQSAKTRANILITGETGVGKTAVARAIHAMSDRAAGPFVEVNCAVLHESLIESELFGYEKGAFTGAAPGGKVGKIELANHGTLFLDEIGELPPQVQSKLLQLIQEKTIERVSGTRRISLDLRLVVATNRDLEEEVRRGSFRSDLYYRLNVIRIRIPPLRERREDILPLAQRFLQDFCKEYGRSLAFSPRFLAWLENQSWRGNVRELQNLIERLVIITPGSIIDSAEGDDEGARAEPGRPVATLQERMEAYEGQIIREYYAQCGSSVALAKMLGISQPTAARKIAKYVRGG